MNSFDACIHLWQPHRSQDNEHVHHLEHFLCFFYIPSFSIIYVSAPNFLLVSLISFRIYTLLVCQWKNWLKWFSDYYLISPSGGWAVSHYHLYPAEIDLPSMGWTHHPVQDFASLLLGCLHYSAGFLLLCSLTSGQPLRFMTTPFMLFRLWVVGLLPPLATSFMDTLLPVLSLCLPAPVCCRCSHTHMFCMPLVTQKEKERRNRDANLCC